MIRHRVLPALVLAALVGACNPSDTAPATSAADAVTPASLLKELVEINTGPTGVEPTTATRAMASRLRAGGFAEEDVQLLGPDSAHLNLVATLRGRDREAKPIVLLAHIDVVEALAADWTVPPFEFTERDGYYYGRGTTDNKGGAAILVASMLRMKAESIVPQRDLILVLTVDEETLAERGIKWILANVPEVSRAEYGLNADAGGFLESEGLPPQFFFQSSEKMYLTLSLEVVNRGGHSSLPRSDNAIYALSNALNRIERHKFPVMYNEVTRETFRRSAGLERGERAADLAALVGGAVTGSSVDRVAQDPSFNGNLRTTCVATMLSAGHAENALPQRATATVNCRVFPGVSVDTITATLARVVGDTAVHITVSRGGVASPASPLRPDVLQVVERVAGEVWKGAVVIPIMENGATDGLYLRNVGIPVYGLAGPLFDSADDRAHGQDERIRTRYLHEAAEFWFAMLKGLFATAP